MESMDLSKATLPKIYQRNKLNCYLDPIRKKLIYITPEETVRQRVISYLLRELKVPENMIFVEEPLSHFGLRTRDRADIVICALTPDSMQAPLAVIECKAESVYLDERAFDQAQRYSDALGSMYTLLTNGEQTFCYKFDERENKYIQIRTLPEYGQMLEGKYVEEAVQLSPPRIAYERLADALRASFDAAGDDYLQDISSATPFEMALALFNFEEALLDERVKMPVGDHGLFRLVEDYGVRMLTYGNGSGGQFFGPYRSFLVDVDGNTEFYSIGLATYWKSSWDLTEQPPKTAICVAHDDEKISHHALQLVAEDNLVLSGKTLRFYHHGRIAVGRIGSGRKEGLMELVSKRYPKIIHQGGYYLGTITADHLLRLDEPDMIGLVADLISYSIVRDEYRQIVKSAKK